MKSLRSSRRGLIISGAAALASAAFVRSAGRAAQFEFKCGSDLPPDHPSSVGLTQMWAAIEKESGGRIHTQFFPNSQLGGGVAMFSQVRVGALQFLCVSAGVLSAVVPTADVGYLGFAYRDADEALRVLDGPVGSYIQQESTSKGIRLLRSVWDSGMYQLSSSSHPIRAPEDLRGFKVRVIESRIAVDLFKGLGASPVGMGFNEIYTSLQTKVVDGTSTPLVTIETAKFYEVQKYISLTNHAWSGLCIVGNGEVWKSLGPELQGIVERNNTKYALLERRQTKAVNATIADKLAGQGVTINHTDPVLFHPYLGSYYKTWQSNFGPTMWSMLENTLHRKIIV